MLKQIKEKLAYCGDTVLITNTANETNRDQILADKVFEGKPVLNLQLHSEIMAHEILTYLDGRVRKIYIDVEQKQPMNLFHLAQTICLQTTVYPLKANDMTVLATDNIILEHFNKNVYQKQIVILGNGNLAFKIMLQMVERGATVSMLGRNLAKSQRLVEAVNEINFAHTDNKAIAVSELPERIDCFISAISAKQQVTSEQVENLAIEGLVLDVGIGNFRPEAMKQLLANKIAFYRVDIQAALPSFMAESTRFFSEIRGVRTIDGTSFIAGGIVGQAGDVIVDNVHAPKQILGIADGLGGVSDMASNQALYRKLESWGNK
ncbi:hypothetical protein HCA69_05690 [Listeria grandensis]|uniref:Quinate/shikimate 5-dehydrogenase/glutamyl-tRNA reductase domain-containing protein n=1 Tax=Listeria grandensis TaxID=1494963 RepID=A0A7X0Y2J6_9LIST|nr:hypothetical protein [Listeria grandensis]MBC1935851.1 hypothetical protein [Listeria grandensis]